MLTMAITHNRDGVSLRALLFLT